MAQAQRAIFIDRDGTLVEPRHYPSLPEHLVLYEGIGPHLAALQADGFRLVIVTNQAGIARGYFDEDDLARMHAHLCAELQSVGIHVDAIYFCPHHVDGSVKRLAVACGCRKPEPGMLHQAAADLNLDLERSWLVGDILDDVEAGNRVGCRTILVDLGTESLPAAPSRQPWLVAPNTVHALKAIRAAEHAVMEVV